MGEKPNGLSRFKGGHLGVFLSYNFLRLTRLGPNLNSVKRGIREGIAGGEVACACVCVCQCGTSPTPIPALCPCRYRVVVPYPPQSEAEIELREGDVVFVHKRREDGWYKGTLQRTGRTGLFPGSFVESF